MLYASESGRVPIAVYFVFIGIDTFLRLYVWRRCGVRGRSLVVRGSKAVELSAAFLARVVPARVQGRGVRRGVHYLVVFHSSDVGDEREASKKRKKKKMYRGETAAPAISLRVVCVCVCVCVCV